MFTLIALEFTMFLFLFIFMNMILINDITVFVFPQIHITDKQNFIFNAKNLFIYFIIGISNIEIVWSQFVNCNGNFFKILIYF